MRGGELLCGDFSREEPARDDQGAACGQVSGFEEAYRFRVSDVPLTFGMFAYKGDPVVLRDMRETAPALSRLLLPHSVPRAAAGRAAQVYGTAKP